MGISRASAISGFRIRNSMSSPPGRIRPSARRQRSGGFGRHQEACHLPHIPPLFRHPPARGRIRHPDDPGATGAPGRQHDDDLHPCPQPRRSLRTKSDGHPAINLFVAYHHSPYPVSPQPITASLLPPLSPTIRTHAGSRFAGNLPDIDGLPGRALILLTNTVPSQSNSSYADR